MPKKTKEKKEILIPPDPKQCQYIVYRGAWPFATHFLSFGPREKHQCTNKPSVIVTQKKLRPGEKEYGSMSLCNEHWKEMIEAYGEDFATAAPV